MEQNLNQAFAKVIKEGDDLVLVFTVDIIEKMDLVLGDYVSFTQDEDGTITIKKQVNDK